MEKKKRDNWRELAQSCMESGMAVSVWCKSNNIPYTTCRNWLKRLRDEGSLPEAACRECQELSVWGKVEITQPAEAAKESFTAAAYPAEELKLRYGMWTIDISHGFDPALLTRIMKAVEGRC